MRSSLTALLLMFPLLMPGEIPSEFTGKGLRIDYYHSREGETEKCDLAALHEIPYYAGNWVNLADTFLYGAYRVVMETLDGKEIYSKGYSTLYNEWRTTSEAKERSRVFRESLVVPYPALKVVLKLLYRDSENSWHEMMALEVDPASIFIRRESPVADETVDIRVHGATEDKVDIVFLPEGYTTEQKDNFLKDCDMFSSYLFNCSPFAERKEEFNVRAVWVASEDSATDNPGEDVWSRTTFGTSFYTFGSERYLTTEDYWSVMDHASVVPFDHVVVMVNTDKYGGGGVYNFFTIATADHPSSDFLLVHELGHGFAGLGDEYYTSDVAVEEFYPLHLEPWEPNLTTLVSFGSKWQDMLDPDTPVPTPLEEGDTPEPGVYEGGGYTAYGVYRPAVNCTMKSVRYNDFCPVCLRAINSMIDWETGKPR